MCKQIIHETKEIEIKELQYKGFLAGKLSISVVSTGKYVLPYFMSDFIKKHPNIDISIDVTNKAAVIQNLTKNETDFSLVSVLPEDLDLEVVNLLKNRLVLVGANSTEIESKISSQKLATLPLIFREKGSATRNAMEHFLKSKNIIPNYKLELVSNEAVKQAVCAGLGFSIMPIIGMKGELATENLKIIETSGLPIETTWRLVYNRKKQLSPVANAFIKHVKEVKNQVVEKFFGLDKL